MVGDGGTLFRRCSLGDPQSSSRWRKATRVAPRSQKGAEPGPLQIKVGEGGRFCEVPKSSLYNLTRRLNIEISNVHKSKTISNCKVQITNIEPFCGYRGPWILRDGIVLTAGDQTYVPIAQYSEARDRSKYNCADTLIEICSQGKMPLLQVVTENLLTIRATGLDTPFCEIKCELWIDGAGWLRIRDASAPEEKDEDISLLEAARRAYERTRDRPIASFAEAFDNSPDKILRWYCYALIIPRESLGGKPLMQVRGIHPPSRLRETISVRNSHSIDIRPSGIYLMEGNRDVFEDLTVRAADLEAAIATMASWEGGGN